MRPVLTFAIGVLLGTVCGCILAVAVFKVDIDLLGIPYVGASMELGKSITLKQDATQFVVPAGAPVRLEYATGEGVEYYSILFRYYGDPIARTRPETKTSRYAAEAVVPDSN